VIPADVDIEFRFRRYPSVHVYLHYELGAGRTVPVPAMQDLGLRFDSFFGEIEQIVAGLSTNRTRVEVKLWDLLWELADRYAARALGGGGEGGRHPAVARVLSTIELHLGADLRVEDLAAQADISHNHLTRLFRQEMGTTVVGYIRQRRMERARHLLEHSTRPIKSIAAEVGIPDLQHFNKLVRRELGRSPRGCRGQAPPS
jgi:transcriptional regulator GlxA family with amidase domain